LADKVGQLGPAHAGFAANSATWGEEIETAYVSVQDLEPAATAGRSTHLYGERGRGSEIQSGPLDPRWLFHLRVLVEHGRSIVGPTPSEMVATVSDENLKEAASWGVHRWLARYQNHPGALDRVGIRVFAVLTACRLLTRCERSGGLEDDSSSLGPPRRSPDLMAVIEGANGLAKKRLYF